MILLDTNVVSEMMRPIPEPKVVTWLNFQSELSVWICSVTVAEIYLGIALLPEGKCKYNFLEIIGKIFSEDFCERCLSFDLEAAKEYSRIVSRRKNEGCPISVEDAQIAAIAVVNGLILATRNTKDFENIPNLKLINPWQSDFV